jgi:hypothetical protein
MNRIVYLAAGLLATSAAAKDSSSSATLHYRPPPDAVDRPLPVDISVGPKGSDLLVKVTFDQVPWGEECKNRCANATLFLDTDDNRTTGLRMGDGKPETGADLAVTIQGAREYKEKSADVFLRAKVRQLADGDTALEHGEVIAELTHRTDPERVTVDKKAVTVLVDATNLTIPSGKTMRVVYHPPADKALEATGKGMLASSNLRPELFSGKKSKAKPKRR